MQIRIPAQAIHEAWPDRLRDLFHARGVKLVPTNPPYVPESIHFVEPCSYHWDEMTGDLVVDQQ